MAALALRLSGAGKTYRRGDVRHVAFAGVDLEVRAGEILALLGPSGCGKSTLLRTIAGLEQLDEGRLHIGLGGDPAHAVGIAFQQPSLLPWLTVRGNVGLGLRFAANRSAVSEGIVDRTIAELGLADVADALPDELSGGQAQRANVARLIVTGRPILLLDEPFASLDPLTRAGLQDWLATLQRAHRLTVVVVTHDVSEALRLGDRVALMTGAPGSISRTWDVSDTAGSGHETRGREVLHREILDHYDRHGSSGGRAGRSRSVPTTTIELEGVPG